MAKKTTLRKISDTEAMEKAVAQAGKEKYVLKLYITGMTRRSQEALRSLEKICRQHLAGNVVLEVIDIYQQPELAKGDQIVAVPTLIKKLPLPLRKFIGDMTNIEQILVGLDLRKK